MEDDEVSWPFFTASRKPMSRSERSVGDNRPARTSMTVTLASVVDSVSKIRIWSGDRRDVDDVADVGMKAIQRAFGRSVSNARVGT